MTFRSLFRTTLVCLLTLCLIDIVVGVVTWKTGWSPTSVWSNQLFQEAPASQQGYEWRPGSRDLGMWISSQGLRNREIGEPGSSAQPLMVVLGDSIVAGRRGPVETTIPGQLERQLENRWRVVNGGLSSTNVIQQSMFYERRLKPLNPQLVILVFSGAHLDNAHTNGAEGNDFVDRHQEDWVNNLDKNRSEGLGGIPLPGKAFLRKNSLLYGYVSDVFHKSLVTVGLRKKPEDSVVSRIHEKNVDDLGKFAGEGWVLVKEGLLRLKAQLEPNGVPLVIVYSPPLAVFENNRVDPLGQSFCESLSRRLEVPVHNLAPAIRKASLPDSRGARPLYRDALHYTRKGTHVTARSIRLFLKEKGFIE